MPSLLLGMAIGIILIRTIRWFQQDIQIDRAYAQGYRDGLEARDLNQRTENLT